MQERLKFQAFPSILAETQKPFLVPATLSHGYPANPWGSCDMKNLTALCLEWGASLDVMRKLLAKDPALLALGTRIGASRGYTPNEAKKLKAAYDSRLKRRETAVSA